MKHSKPRLIVHVRHDRERLAHDKAARWLSKHEGDAPLIDAKAERKRMRKALYEKDRMRRRNAAVRRGSATAPQQSPHVETEKDVTKEHRRQTDGEDSALPAAAEWRR